MFIHTFKIGNFEYHYMASGYNSGSNGIILNYQTASLNDPEYIKGLQIILDESPAIEAWAYVVEMKIYTIDQIANQMSDTTFSKIIVQAGLAETSTLVDLDDKFREFVEQCREYAERRLVTQRRKERQLTPGYRGGYVYLIQSPTEAYKIGRSKDPKDRMATFSVKLPFEVKYIHLIPTRDMYLLEKQLQDKFEHKRIDGEWFALDAYDVEYIKAIGGDA